MIYRPTAALAAGRHADIVRELIDGAAGLTPDRPNLPPGDQASWLANRDRVERAAQEAARASSA